jgi:hypothetical protein
LDVAAGANLITRKFTYKDDLFGKLRPYSLNGWPAIKGRIIWYPAAHATDGIVANFGVDLSAEYAVGLQSKNASGMVFPTRAYDLMADARGRIPIGEHEVILVAGVGQGSFHIGASTGGLQPDIPSVTYTYIRAGAEGLISLFDRLSARTSVAVRTPLSIGDIRSTAWFPAASAIGIDAGLVIGVRIAGGLEARAGIEVVRWALSMNPKPGDTNVAGGAVDQYLEGTLVLAWRM